MGSMAASETCVPTPDKSTDEQSPVNTCNDLDALEKYWQRRRSDPRSIDVLGVIAEARGLRMEALTLRNSLGLGH